MTEVEDLKKAVVEAERKAVAELALREKHEARVIEAEQELQEVVKRCEALEQSVMKKESDRGSNLCSQEDSVDDIYLSSSISRRM